ncbi:MAG: molybdopterin-guanine dinucleotide biosynthesis protein B [Clostridiales bacterium]|mgnify:CR=1 FL=1|nr:molybdopterin-guanine dinucleotide biosynthesis protein B [Clostridiales bacterium]
MAFVVNVIASNSNVGKTTLIVGLVKELKSRGYRIATIKHDAHDFEIDQEGKDTWKHRQAGADTGLISSKSKIALIKSIETEAALEQLVDMVKDDVDFVIIEGYKGSSFPKIEVYREGVSERRLDIDDTFIAVATDSPDAIDDVVVVLDINNYKEIADFLINYFKRGAKC